MKHTHSMAIALAALFSAPAFAETPLKSALDGNAPPFAMPKMDGTIEGLSVDMTAEIAKRIGREISVEPMAFSALIPALTAGTFDMLSVPLGISQERSDAFLLTEGIWSAPSAFLIAAKADQLTDMSQMKGKKLATNKGNADDKWAREKAAEYGWTVDSYGSLNDAAQAVQSGRADAAIVSIATAVTIAKRSPAVKVSTLRLDRGTYYTYPLPKGSEALREKIEGAIECIKSDGTAAKLYEKWLGETPAAGSLEVTPQPGYGPVGFGNYNAAEHKLSCN